MKTLKVTIKCLSVLSVWFVFQTQALNKKEVFNHPLPAEALDFHFNEEAAPVIGEAGSEVNELKSAWAKLNSPKENREVSHVVLFEEGKPVCVANAVRRPELVPHFMKVKAQDSEAAALPLPACDDFQLSVLEAKAQEALLINGKEPVQMAAFMESMLLCTLGGAGSIGAVVLEDAAESSFSKHSKVDITVAVFGTAIAPVGSFVALKYFSEFAAFSYLRGFSIVGLCGLGIYSGVKYLEYLTQ